jgi:hypothetical protein
MTEDLLSKNPMDEDLLTRIQRETCERLLELRGTVDEHDRLQAELSALDTPPEPPTALDIDSELPTAPEADPEPPRDPEPPVAPEPSAKVVRLPTRPRLPRTRIVSPKVARLMRAPRRPALERAGVVRVGVGRVDYSTDELAEEVDAEAV